MNTCGLDHAFFMESRSAEHYAYPAREAVDHPLHGRSALTPARLAGYGTRWEGDECVLWAEGEVIQAAMFGEDLHLVRRIEARMGGSGFTVEDRVENRGFARTPAHASLPREPRLAAPRRGERVPSAHRAGDVAKPRGVSERGRLPHDAAAPAGGVRRAGPHPRGGCGGGRHGSGRPRQSPARPRWRRRPRPSRSSSSTRGASSRCSSSGRACARAGTSSASSPPPPTPVVRALNEEHGLLRHLDHGESRRYRTALLGRRRVEPRSRPSRRASTRCTTQLADEFPEPAGIGQNRLGHRNETTGESP